MSWSPHQLDLLRGMGLRVWQPASQIEAPLLELPVVLPAARSESVRAARPALTPQPREPREPLGRPNVEVAMTRAPSLARPELSTLAWPELRQAVSQCTACGLCQSRKQTVFGVGHLQAQWLVVGEAPGEQEDLQGQPFVGSAGQLLDRMLAALHLTRSEDGQAKPEQRVYITNTLKCRPPRNRNPAPEEMVQCEPFLLRQIELLKPRIILAMGAFAVKALLGSEEPLGKLRGRVHRYQGTPVVVTYHPSYLLRRPAEKAKSWADLCLAAQAAEGA
jgi:uracil-DNA glycosylase